MQADWGFAPGCSSLIGARYANTRVKAQDHFIVTRNADDSGSMVFRSWLPVAGVRCSPGAWTWHVATSRGAETPTLNELAYRPDGTAGLNSGLRASRSRNIEVGGRWTNDSLVTELVVFRIDTTDEIVVSGSGGGRTTFRNASGTVRDGLEASVQWQLLPGIDAVAAYTLIDARYEADLGGHRLPGVPRHNLFGELAWRGGPVRVAFEGLYRGAVSVDDANTDAAPAWAVFNARLSARLQGLEFLARLDNLLGREYAGSVIVNESNGRYFEPAPKRAFGIGLRWAGASP